MRPLEPTLEPREFGLHSGKLGHGRVEPLGRLVIAHKVLLGLVCRFLYAVDKLRPVKAPQGDDRDHEGATRAKGDAEDFGRGEAARRGRGGGSGGLRQQRHGDTAITAQPVLCGMKGDAPGSS
jgi:hypothetical protein